MRGWKAWTALLTVLAAAVAVIAVVLTGDRGGEPPVITSPTPTVAPTTEPTSPEPTSPDPTEATTEPTAEPTADAWYVVTDGEDVILRSVAGGDAVTLYDGPSGPDAETTVEHVAVRPGSTTADLTVVFTRSGEGMYDLWYATITDHGAPVAEAFPDAYQPRDVEPGSGLRPAWSPDGAHLAWVTMPADGSTPGLMTIGWSDGPGTGRDADDNAAFTLDGLPTGAYTITAWTWETAGTATSGALTMTTPTMETWRVTLERQSDGALALPADAIEQLDEVPSTEEPALPGYVSIDAVN